MRNMVVVVFATCVAACSIDARTTEVAAPSGGGTTGGGAAADADEGLAYTIAYTAPDDFTGTPVMKSNASGGWDPVGVRDGRKVTWETRFDAARLTWSPCLATTTGARCGYLLNVELPGYVPGFAVTQDGYGALREVGARSVSGPACVRLDTVDNGLRGGNYWLHACE